MENEKQEQVTPPDMWGATEEEEVNENKDASGADENEQEQEPNNEVTEDNGEKKAAPAEGELPEGFAKRVARANRQRDKAREKAERLEAELATLKSTQLEAAKQPTPKPEPEPNPADFEDYEAYLEEKKTFDAKPKPEPAPEKAPVADAPPALTAREEMAKEDVVDYMQDDFPEVLKAVSANNDVVITGRMLTALNEMDHPETLLQAFVDDPSLSIKIARSRSDIAMARAMTKHDKPLEAKSGKKANTSKAPNPIEPQEGATDVRKQEPKDFAEFEKQRREEIANRNADSGYL